MEVVVPFANPDPMPVAPKVEIEPLTIVTDAHVSPTPAPIPAAFEPPKLCKEPPEDDSIERFEERKQAMAARSKTVAFRTFEVSRIMETELPEIEIGDGDVIETFERRMVAFESSTAMPCKLDLPVTRTGDLELEVTLDPLHCRRMV
jgi:hypothetical protein